MDDTYNLTTFANQLLKEKRHVKLAKLIQQSLRLNSLGTDIMLAADSMQLLKELLINMKGTEYRPKLIAQMSLINNAVVLYARATKTDSKAGRPGYNVGPYLSDAQKKFHDEVVDYRDHGIAHFGHGGRYSAEIQTEISVLHVRGDRMQPSIATRRKILDGQFGEKLHGHLVTVFPIFDKLTERKFFELKSELERIFEVDPAIISEMMTYPLNMPIFMTSDAGANARYAELKDDDKTYSSDFGSVSAWIKFR